jgi:hypothetical protein
MYVAPAQQIQAEFVCVSYAAKGDIQDLLTTDCSVPQDEASPNAKADTAHNDDVRRERYYLFRSTIPTNDFDVLLSRRESCK